MLETLVASILNRFLGSYVENFDPNKLKIGLLSGDVKLGGLKLKRSVLDKLQLPIDVLEGHIGNLVLQIPYSNLKSKPVKIFIEDVFLLAGPEQGGQKEGQKRRAQSQKMERLGVWELNSERAVRATPEADVEQGQNFTTSLVTKIIENVQVTIRNIHVRFEDPTIGSALGLTLGELSAVSTNSDWEPAFIAEIGATTQKLVTLDSLALYMDPEMRQHFGAHLSAEDGDTLLDEFKSYIFDSIGENDIIRPINGQGFITLNKQPKSEYDSKVTADLRFEELSLSLDRAQYVNALQLIDYFQSYFQTLEFKQNRPKESVHDAPLKWFKYVAQTVVDRVREKRKVWTWDYIKQHLDDQREYINLYTKFYANGLQDGVLSPGEQQRFDALQEKYPYDDLVLFRSLAKKLMIRDGLTRKQEAPQQQSWSQWLWGTKSEQQAQAQPLASELALTEDQRQELLDMLDTPLSVDVSAAQVLLAVEFSLRSASIRFRNGERGLLSAGLEGIKAAYTKRLDAFNIEASIVKAQVADMSHQNRFSNTLQVQDAHSDVPLVWVQFQHHPADHMADSNLFLKLQRLLLVHNAQLIESLVEFFRPPPDQNQTVEAIITAANRTVEELREQTRLGLEYALEHHKTLNLQLDIKSPTFVIPLDPSNDDSPAAILCFGALSIVSELVPQHVLSEVKSRQALQYTQEDWRRLESLMYDRFAVTFRDTQILLGERMSDLDLALNKKSSKLHFIDKTTLEFLLELSIVPQNRNLTKCRLSITMAELRTTFNDVQYKLMLQLLAKVHTPSEPTQSAAETPAAPVPATAPSSPDVLLAQKTFELKIIVNQAVFLVVRGWDAQPLMELCFNEFHFKLWTLTNNPDEVMGLQLKVADLLVTDHVANAAPPALRKLAESHPQAAHGDHPNLFVVNYQKSASGDQNVSIVLSEIHFVYNPESTLTVYDYIMSTFTSPASEAGPVAVEQTSEPAVRGGCMNVQMNMTGVSLVLCDQHAVAGTLHLKRGTLNVLLESSLKVRMTLGEVRLVDADRNDLLSIDAAGDLADFRYQTEPPSDGAASGLTSIYLRLGTLRLSVCEGPLTKIMSILTRFSSMKAVYDQARLMASNQAIQVEPDKMKFDILIATPVILWPHTDGWLRFNLGELHLKNTLTSARNDVSAGIRDVQVSSSIANVEQEIVNRTEFSVDISYVPVHAAADVAVAKITSELSPVHAHVSEVQYYLLLQFATVVSNIMQSTAGIGQNMDDVGNLRRKLAEEKQIGHNQTSYWWGENFSLDLGGKDTEMRNEQLESQNNGQRLKLQFDFDAPLLDVTLYLQDSPLSFFECRQFHADVAMKMNNEFDMNFHIRTFAAEDLNQARCNQFPHIIPSVKHDAYQVIGSVARAQDVPMQINCSIDSPQVIVAVEYAIALKEFLAYAASRSEIPPSDDDDSDSIQSLSSFDIDSNEEASLVRHTTATDVAGHNSSGELSYIGSGSTARLSQTSLHEPPAPKLERTICINVVDMSLTVLADEKDPNSEAIVFKIEHLVLNSQRTTTCTLSKVGVFLTRMQSFDSSRLRILDDFNVVGTLDNSESSSNLLLTNAQLMLEPLVLRLSLREIGLIMEIAKKAGAVYGDENRVPSIVKEPKQKLATVFSADDHRVARRSKRSVTQNEIQQNLPSLPNRPAQSSNTESLGRGSHDDANHQRVPDEADAEPVDPAEMVRTKRVLSEQLVAEFQGLRVVLIDPLHQLPLTDFCIKPFSLVAENWSDVLSIQTKAEIYANFHSFTKSAWEPLVDSFELKLKVKERNIEISSDEIINLDFSSETLHLFNDIQEYFNSSEAPTDRKRIEDEEPYRVVNETGLPIVIWQDSNGSGSAKRDARVKVSDGSTIGWSFHDWRQLREDLSATDQDAMLGMEFVDKQFSALRSIPVNSIGEHVYTIVDNENQQKHKIIFDVSVLNHLKWIRIRSSVVLHNATENDLEIMLMMPNKQREVMTINACSSKPLPIGLVESSMLVRCKGSDRWSKRSIVWTDFKDENSKLVVECAEDYFLSVIPVFKEVQVVNYPHMDINLTAPLQVVNNLPLDMEFQIYIREQKKKSTWSVKEAGHEFVHVASPDDLLMMQVNIPGYTCKRMAIVNVGRSRMNREFHLESHIELNSDTQRLNLYLDYQDLPNGKGRAIVVHALYVIVNTSDHALVFTDGGNSLTCEAPSLNLWSFGEGNERMSHRVTISTNDSANSAPVSLDASGSVFEVALVSRDHKRVLYMGGMVSQGTGRYLASKIVTISPRFIVYNQLERPLEFREPGASRENDTQTIRVESGAQCPVGFIRAIANREICARLGDSEDCQWSSSLPLYNVGTTFVRLSQRMKPTVLAQVDIILEEACLFVRFSVAKTWPFSIRNFTDQDFVFYQSDPSLDEDGVPQDQYDGRNRNYQFTPILYNLPPRSAMPYSWDFPAADVKQIVLQLPRPVSGVASLEGAPQLPPRIAAGREGTWDRRSSVESFAAPSISTLRSGNTQRQLNEYRMKQKTKYRKIQLGEIGQLPPAHLGRGIVVGLSVIADGPQQALIIDDHNPEISPFDDTTNEVKPEAFEEIKQMESNAFVFQLKFKGIGVSCIDGQGQELLYATLHNSNFTYSMSDALQSVALQVQWIQVDNMLPKSSTYPVFIYPSVLPKAPDELAAHPCFSASLMRIVDDSYGLTYVKHATFLMQEMTIEADEDLLLAIVQMVVDQGDADHGHGSNPELNNAFDTEELLISKEQIKTPEPESTNTPDIYFEQLHLQPTQLNLSFMRTGALKSSSIFKNNALGGNLSFMVDALTMTIGNINDAPVRFNALLVDNVRTRMSNLVSMIRLHYEQEFLYQIHKIVGSADIIGNPVGLFNNISSGVMDLFYEPYLGYTLSDRPRELGIGIARGGINFMKKSVFGLSDSFTKVTGSISKGLAALTMDTQYQNQHRARRIRNRPVHAVSGLKFGAMSLYDSVVSGFTGLAEQPLQGAMTDGSAGFFKGLCIGLIGLPTKTTIGLLDFASNLSEGIRNTTTVFDSHSVDRIRLPRVIFEDGVLRPYNIRDSVGQMILRTVKDAEYSGDHYLAHTNITKNKVVVVSLERVLVASVNDMKQEWMLKYSEISSVILEQTGIIIRLVGNVHGPFLPLTEESTRRYIYKNIAKGVELCNRNLIAMN